MTSSSTDRASLYRLFGRVVACDRPLPELPISDPTERVTFQIRWPSTFAIPDGLRWSVVWRSPSSDPVVSFARAGPFSFMRFAGAIDVRLSSEGLIEACPHAALEDTTIRHVLLDQVVPLALAAAGEAVLHASAVLVEGRSVLFLGDAGMGKSTLAAALCRAGFTLFADDVVLLQESEGAIHAVSSYPGLRLWPDAADNAGIDGRVLRQTAASRGKRRFVPHGESLLAFPDAAPIGCVYSLSAADSAVGLTRLSRRDVVVELVRHAFNAEPDDRAAVHRQLERMTAWSARLDVWRAAYRRDFTEVPAIAAALISHVRGELSTGS